MERIALAALHLLALGIGLGAILARWITLRRPLSPDSVRRVLHFDNQWGLAAMLWIVTGLWRWLGSIEKSTAYYNANHWFYAKMALFALVFALEIRPMLTLIRWRRALRRGTDVEQLPGIQIAREMSNTSAIQALLVVAMVVLATMMARGYGAMGR